MAKNIQPLEDPPIASSSDGEDLETSSGEEEESNKPPADSDSGSETDSDSDMDEEPSKSPVKPAAAADSETELFVSSYLVKSIARHGLDEDYVKQKWRSAPVEDKKRIEEMYKLLRAKEGLD